MGSAAAPLNYTKRDLESRTRTHHNKVTREPQRPDRPSATAAHPVIAGGPLKGLTVWSIGHSTHLFEDFVSLLSAHDVEQIADVRRFPGSRRHPQFAELALREGLAEHGIGYAWLPALGGRRVERSSEASASGWRHPAFRAYAAHLGSDEFADGLDTLIRLASERRVAMMCSESLWWRCHRRLISDVLVAQAAQVVHIFSDLKSEPHVLRPPARLVDGRLVYSEALHE